MNQLVPAFFLVAALCGTRASAFDPPAILNPQVAGQHGESAIAALGEHLADVAARHAMSTNELEQLLRDDASLRVDEDGRLFFVDPPAPRLEPQDESEAGAARGGVPADQALTMHSLPGADRTIYLDFDGHHSVNNVWGHDIIFPPYNTSGSSSTFSNGELLDIIEIWKYVAEDFSAFQVNVTTEDPGLDALTKENGADQTFGVRCLMTQPTGGFGNGIGGVAYLGSFGDQIDNPVFVFNKGLNNGSMSASHEVGHALGLSHDGLNGSAYHPGVGSGPTSWGPIMGAPFGKSVVQWSNGRYEGATTGQHDYGVMENQGAPRKLDDYTGDPQTAIQMRPDCESGLLIVSGIIEKKPDTDAFRFESTGGTVTIAGVPAAVGPNVDVELELYDSDSVLIATASPAGDLSAGLSQSLTAGEYTVVIDGTYDVLYSDYGSIGQYTLSITGAVVVPPVCTGDLNCDGAVNITDLGTLLANFGMTTGATLADGDVSGDGAVDITDLGALLAGFGLSC